MALLRMILLMGRVLSWQPGQISSHVMNFRLALLSNPLVGCSAGFRAYAIVIKQRSLLQKSQQRTSAHCSDSSGQMRITYAQGIPHRIRLKYVLQKITLMKLCTRKLSPLTCIQKSNINSLFDSTDDC